MKRIRTLRLCSVAVLAVSGAAAWGVGVGPASASANPPSVTTYNASPVWETGADLHGAVNPESMASDCHFEYGTSESLGASVPCSASSVPGVVFAMVSGLRSGTIYYFRLVASNGEGTSQGFDAIFQTTTQYTRQYTRPQRGIPPQNPNDVGLEVSYCPKHAGASSTRASAAGTSEAGWPPKQCLKMDKGPAGEHHTIVGERGVHNWLLGGYGNDTIIGGNIGDVIWADYQPSGEPKHQTATIHAGNGRNVIYANDTVNHVWTGTNPRTVVHAHVSGISGDIHCQSPGIVLFLSITSERHFKLYGCHHISHFSVGY
jgi:hypothetical protein